MKTAYLERLFSDGGCVHIPTQQDMHSLWLHSQAKKGWVYIAENSEHLGLLKIGYTQKDPFTRAKSLKTAGVVGTFRVVRAYQFVDCIAAESGIHLKLAALRVDGEFFRISESDANIALQSAWREEREALALFRTDWLLLDRNADRWTQHGFNMEKWMLENNKNEMYSDTNRSMQAEIDDLC